MIPLRRRRRAVTPLTTITTATITFSLSSFHSPPRLFPRINLFRLWKVLPLHHRSLLLQLLIIDILAMTLPGLNFTSEKTSNIPVHCAYWASPNKMTPVGPRPAGTLNRRPFQSTRLKREIYKPWLEKQYPAMRCKVDHPFQYFYWLCNRYRQ